MNVQVLEGDARVVLATLPEQSVRCCVTSPPYWGLRDYGVDGQIGLESTPDAYVDELVSVFRAVRRVLTDDGTLWLNLGDSYAGGGCGARDAERWPKQSRSDHMPKHAKTLTGLKTKDLVGIPWRVAFALQADGWYLRSDIIWHKPNPMPESVTDRPTKSHEYVCLLSKSDRYYYDSTAIREPDAGQDHDRGARGPVYVGAPSGVPPHTGIRRFNRNGQGRNRRTVWTIPTRPFVGAHFATFPTALVEPCVKAGSAIGDTVLDPFGGSGTTALVAESLDRHSILVELNPSYAAMARNRISAATEQVRLV